MDRPYDVLTVRGSGIKTFTREAMGVRGLCDFDLIVKCLFTLLVAKLSQLLT